MTKANLLFTSPVCEVQLLVLTSSLNLLPTGNVNALEVLLDRGVDVNVKTKHGDTPLHYASRKGFPQIIELLVSHGADLNITSEFGSLEQVAKEFNKVIYFTLFGYLFVYFYIRVIEWRSF